MILICLAFAVCCCTAETVDEAYHPAEPIEFSHLSHAQFDCKCCHNAVTKSKTDKLPTVNNVCIHCHREKDGNAVIDSAFCMPIQELKR